MPVIDRVSEEVSVVFNVGGSAPQNFANQVVNGGFLRLSRRISREIYVGRAYFPRVSISRDKIKDDRKACLYAL